MAILDRTRLTGRALPHEKSPTGLGRSGFCIWEGKSLIIDIHTHVFPESIAQRAVRQLQQNSHIALYSDGTEADLLAHEKQARVDLAVVQPVATNPDKVEHMNDAVIKANRDGWGRGALSFGAMHPAYSGWKRELERIKEAGVPGIKLHPPYEGIAIDDCRAVAVLRKRLRRQRLG